MLSVICVYNDAAALKRILIPSLAIQTVSHDLILIDNTTHKWKSAASALNYGATCARGKYLMFVHQDVELGSQDFLADMEATLDSFSFGIVGSIGMSTEGATYQQRLRGFICNAGQDWGNPIISPQLVQTLDECLLITPREGFQGFDAKTFDHWHCYGGDYALRMNEQGHGAYAVPGYIYHRSRATNTDQLRKYHLRLFFKHRNYYSKIYATTNGLTWFNIFATPMISPLQRINKVLFPSWLDIAKHELKGCKTILDLGCGYNSPIQFLGNDKELTGVEIFDQYIIESRKKALHQHYIQDDVRNVGFDPRSFDAVFCSEVLEHLPREDGEQLLNKMSVWAKEKVIITTPNGWLNQGSYDKNPYQEHQSGWTVEDLKAHGFRVIGMSGAKKIRGEQGVCTVKPEFLGMRLASLTHKVTRHIPEWDFQLLGIKNIDT
jgi:2-polyprenyl-3-methyl-5-hydroxy-6-metoxy-1,4-benzoquinol methylase